MAWFHSAGGPYLIAGPCSAESPEQLRSLFQALSPLGVNLFRAGIWKPRTRPGSFEGMGELALSWLQELKKEFPIPTAVEVGEPKHVELALKYGIDVLWIGARTTVNPFLVQQLADALRGTSVPIMVKNPVNPDLNLWLGAIERFEQASITDLAAIHRGFSLYHNPSQYRNPPHWSVPVELKRIRPDLPLFSDPSHIAGRRDKIAELAQKAMDMGFDGLMIETHSDPEQAWSDAGQQIQPDELKSLLDQLVLRDSRADRMGNKGMALEQLRQEMDAIDVEIIDLLVRRLEYSEKIGWVKKQENLTAYQPDRWREIIETRTHRGEKFHLNRQFILQIFQAIHDESIRTQLEILAEKEKSLDT